MKRIVILLVLAVVSVARCFTATFDRDPRTIPALIDLGNSMGSGCFLHVSNSVYLVTAKHVLFVQPNGTNAPALRSSIATVKSFSGSGTTNVSARLLSISLQQLLSAGEIRFSTNRDLALVRVEACPSTNLGPVLFLPGVSFLSPQTGLDVLLSGPAMLCPANEIDIGADVIMFGYPTVLTSQIRDSFDPSEPLLRKGIVAGINLEKRTIIIDCPAYFGNSGGPVVQLEGLPTGLRRFRIIGLVVRFVPFVEEWENKTMGYSHVIASNSGYTVVEPIETVLEMVWK